MAASRSSSAPVNGTTFRFVDTDGLAFQAQQQKGLVEVAAAGILIPPDTTLLTEDLEIPDEEEPAKKKTKKQAPRKAPVKKTTRFAHPHSIGNFGILLTLLFRRKNPATAQTTAPAGRAWVREEAEVLAGWGVTTASADCLGKDTHNLYYSRVVLTPPAAGPLTAAAEERWPWDPLTILQNGSLVVETGTIVSVWSASNRPLAVMAIKVRRDNPKQDVSLRLQLFTGEVPAVISCLPPNTKASATFITLDRPMDCPLLKLTCISAAKDPLYGDAKAWFARNVAPITKAKAAAARSPAAAVTPSAAVTPFTTTNTLQAFLQEPETDAPPPPAPSSAPDVLAPSGPAPAAVPAEETDPRTLRLQHFSAGSGGQQLTAAAPLPSKNFFSLPRLSLQSGGFAGALAAMWADMVHSQDVVAQATAQMSGALNHLAESQARAADAATAAATRQSELQERSLQVQEAFARTMQQSAQAHVESIKLLAEALKQKETDHKENTTQVFALCKDLVGSITKK